MQAMPVMAVMPKNAGKPAQAAGAGNEGAVAEGVDFSALLLAQIKGGQEADPKFAVSSEAEDLKSALMDIPAQQEDESLTVGEALLAEGLIPVAAIVVQQPASPIQAAPAAAPLGKSLGDVTSTPDVLGQFNRELPKTSPATPDVGRVAEFAVDGKMLPQNRLEKSEGGLSLPALSPEPQRVSEIPASALSAMMVTSHSSGVDSKATPLSPATLHVPVASSGWGDALGQKVVWMAGQQTQVAELHLNPPHLGPMEVRLSISNDQVSALFVSHQPAVREAIEAAMPRLREMFADSGMTLGNATVSSDSLPQQQTSGREGQSGSSRPPEFSAIGNVHSSRHTGGAIPLRHDGSGMVDLFA